MGWKRNGGFQKQHCDLSILMAVLRKAGEARILAIALRGFAMDHVSDHWIRVPFCMNVMSHHANEYIAWALVSEKVSWGSELHSWAHRSVIKPQLGFLKAWQKPKTPFNSSSTYEAFASFQTLSTLTVLTNIIDPCVVDRNIKTKGKNTPWCFLWVCCCLDSRRGLQRMVKREDKPTKPPQRAGRSRMGWGPGQPQSHGGRRRRFPWIESQISAASKQVKSGNQDKRRLSVQCFRPLCKQNGRSTASLKMDSHR